MSQDILPLGEFKTHASRVLRRLREARRPIVITQNGRPAGVLISPEEFDRLVEHDRFVTAAAPVSYGTGRITPTSPSELLATERETILQLAERHGARNVRVFGSVARGDATGKSDLDLLVDMEDGRSLLDLVGLWQDLQDLLGRRVDVISEGGISPYLRAKIIAEAVPL